MKRILPFKGLRYNKNIIGNISALLAPAYGNISADSQKQLYNWHPFNVVRLEYGIDMSGSVDKETRYSTSAETLEDWLHSGVILPDRQPSIYVCNQDFKAPDGSLVSRKGIVCLVRLDDYSKGTVVPHLETIPKQKNDCYNLLLSCNTSFTPVYSLYSNDSPELSAIISDTASLSPELSVQSADKTVTKLWQITDSESISVITDSLENTAFFIADGHHKYEAAIAYRNLLRDQNAEHTGNELYNYVMMFLVNTNEPGLTIFPNHRMIKNVVGFSEQGVISQFDDIFDIMQVEDEDIVSSLTSRLRQSEETPSFVMYTGKDYYYVFRLKNFASIDSANPTASTELRHLDVSVLNATILSKGFGLNDADLRSRSYIAYTQHISEAVERVKSGDFQCSFLFSPAKSEIISAIAHNREKMPEKTTCFYPQPPAGLIMNKLN